MSEIDKVRSLLTDVQRQTADLRRSIVSDRDMSLAVLEDLQHRLQQSEEWNRSVKGIQDIPGLRNPKWYAVEIPFEYGDSVPKSGEVLISAEGPFVCTQVQAYFKITDTDASHYPDTGLIGPEQVNSSAAVGRRVSASSFEPLMGLFQACRFLSWAEIFSAYSVGGGATIIDIGHVYPEFDLQIHIEGSGRAWAGDYIPAAALYGVLSPLYTGISGIIEQSDRIEVIGKPSIPSVTLAGTLNIVFHGYHIGGLANPYDLLGY